MDGQVQVPICFYPTLNQVKCISWPPRPPHWGTPGFPLTRPNPLNKRGITPKLHLNGHPFSHATVVSLKEKGTVDSFRSRFSNT